MKATAERTDDNKQRSKHEGFSNTNHCKSILTQIRAIQTADKTRKQQTFDSNLILNVYLLLHFTVEVLCTVTSALVFFCDNRGQHRRSPGASRLLSIHQHNTGYCTARACTLKRQTGMIRA